MDGSTTLLFERLRCSSRFDGGIDGIVDADTTT
jgi:hypothetical protein